ncbi:MAG: efflux RND transporter periplasmic adaptor subunit [Proteobacteria bacterium]|nr:MAG: efflux RND transporter periplasmic adaptor subunit [Pseudomonadota bacterium]
MKESMTHRLRLIICLLALAQSMAVFSGCGKEESSSTAPAALEVNALRITKKDVPVEMEFVGQTKGSIDAEIRARVEGVVNAIHFKEGTEVKEGQPLYSIDPAPFQAKVAEAQGKLAEAETQLVKAVSDLKRIQPLVKMKAMSERDLDRAVAQEGAARGSVDAAMANVEAAKIELGYCEISSPITGIIGLTKAKVGEFVGRPPNPVVLNTVSKLDPIHVIFSISERDYLYFTRLRQKQLDAGETPVKRKLRLFLADGSEYPESGQVTSLERAVDPTTGTIPVEAAFPNVHQLVRPGQFAKIQTEADTIKDAIVVPKRALRELQGQYQAVVIKPDNTAEPRTVTLGSVIGEDQVVESGLSEDEVIALDGLQRLKAGMPVTAKFTG